ETAQDHPQHGAVALDAGGSWAVLCLGQRPRVHSPRRARWRDDPFGASDRRQAGYTDANLLRRDGDVRLPRFLGCAQLLEGQGDLEVIDPGRKYSWMLQFANPVSRSRYRSSECWLAAI